jgi:hypothetical protein
MDRSAFSSENTVAFALIFVAADQTAYRGKRIIFEKHFSGVVQLIVLQQSDHFRNRCIDGTALLTLRYFTAQTTVGFIHNM